MHYLSYHRPQSWNWDERQPELANKGVQWKDKESAFSANFATFYCSTSKCASQCQVLGKSVDWFITTCKWDGRQLLHYGYAIGGRNTFYWQGYLFTKMPCAESCKSLNCMSGVSTKRKFIEVRCSWRPNVYTEICVTNVCDSSRGTLICAPCLWQWSLEHSYKCARCDKSHNVTQPAMLWWLATRYF